MKVLSVNVSGEKGTIKAPVPMIELEKGGIVGDAHRGTSGREVSILSVELINEFEEKVARKFSPGMFAENLTVSSPDLASLWMLDRLSCGDIDMEVSRIGKECHGSGCAVFDAVGKCLMPQYGVFCRVLNGGKVKPGATFTVNRKVLKLMTLTVSDRAYQGEYSDRSGPELQKAIDEALRESRWTHELHGAVVPDDPAAIEARLVECSREEFDAVFITGGTGVGPRDCTPEAVTAFSDRIVPGIMESIRIKFGAEKPAALLSRSVAAVKGTMMIYAMPGSVRAVMEYVPEIFRTFEHCILMMHGLDVH